MEIPKQPNDLHFRNDRWPVIAEALHLMATTGIAVRFELQGTLARRRGIALRSGSMRRIFEHDLTAENLIYDECLPTFGRHRLTVVKLSRDGMDICENLGWTFQANEWERLQTYHSGDNQAQHTGAVLMFARHARLRGWKTQVLPQLGSSVLFPDVLVEKNGQKIYVEVELGTRKLRKWGHMQETQKFVALCAKTTITRRSLIAECKSVGAVGMATDLETLFKGDKGTSVSPLWA